jgi:S-adenosylmethionine/arginine decarboxylase-like enzyme
MTRQRPYGRELVLDLSGCDPDVTTNPERLAAFAAQMCDTIDMKAYGEPIIERFGLADEVTAGHTLVQLIETSSIVVHFSDSRRTAHANVFSCGPFEPRTAADFASDFLGAERSRSRLLIRQ